MMKPPVTMQEGGFGPRQLECHQFIYRIASFLYRCCIRAFLDDHMFIKQGFDSTCLDY